MTSLFPSLSPRAALYFFRAGMAKTLSLAPFEALRMVLMSAILLTWINVWAMIPGGFLAHAGLSFAQIVWYICCTEIVALSVSGIHREIEAMVHDGHFVSALSRPLNWLVPWLSGQLGRASVFLFLFAGVALSVAVCTTGVWLLSPPALLMLGAHLLIAQAIWIVWLTIMGLLVPWAGSVSVPHMIIQKFSFVFGALLMPLSLYPGWLATIAYATPFPAIFGVVGEVVLDPSSAHFIAALAYQLLVLGVSFAALLLTWNRFTHRLLQEG